MLILRPSVSTVGYSKLLVLGSAVAWACAIIVIKVLSRTDTSVTITAYTHVLMTSATLIAASFDWTWPMLEQYGWLVGLGLTGALGHALTAEALKRGDTHVVTPFDFFRLIQATLIGILLFGESVDNFVWIGGTIMIASVSYIAWRELQIAISQSSKSET